MMKHNNIFIYLFLILIILSFSFYNSQFNQVENFIPSIRKMYRPHFRKLRMYQEAVANDINKKSDIFFRRMGLY